MTDLHLRMLTTAARRSRRRLERHDEASTDASESEAGQTRVDLAREAQRTEDQVAAAHGRRRATDYRSPSE